jgi:type IV pilus assembly protein PilV
MPPAMRHLPFSRSPSFSPYRGVTLIEVLVAIVILSIGLLGIAGLQVATAKYKLTSGTRAATAALYSDYTDRIRMNPDMAGTNWVSGGTNVNITSSDADGSKYTYQNTWAAQQLITDTALNALITSANSACDGGSICTPVNRATYDILAWRKRVRESLPQGAAYVEGNIRTGINVTLMWMDKDNTNKSVKVNDGSTSTQVSLVAATSCSAVTATTGLALQTCCPAAASVPAGVRCTRFSFMP